VLLPGAEARHNFASTVHNHSAAHCAGVGRQFNRQDEGLFRGFRGERMKADKSGGRLPAPAFGLRPVSPALWLRGRGLAYRVGGKAVLQAHALQMLARLLNRCPELGGFVLPGFREHPDPVCAGFATCRSASASLRVHRARSLRQPRDRRRRSGSARATIPEPSPIWLSRTSPEPGRRGTARGWPPAIP